MDIFWPAQQHLLESFLGITEEDSAILERLNKTLQSHGKLQSLTDLIHGANIDTHSNSRDWLF